MIFETKIMSAIDSWLYKINPYNDELVIEIKLIRELQVPKERTIINKRKNLC